MWGRARAPQRSSHGRRARWANPVSRSISSQGNNQEGSLLSSPGLNPLEKHRWRGRKEKIISQGWDCNKDVHVVFQSLSHVQPFWDPTGGQAPLTVGFSRQEYWSGLPFPSSGNFYTPGIEPVSLYWQACYLLLSYQQSPWMLMATLFVRAVCPGNIMLQWKGASDSYDT